MGAKDYESLRQTAMRVDTVEAERDRAIKRARVERNKEKERADTAEEKAVKAEKRAKEAMTESPSVKMQIENVELKHRLERVERWLQRFIQLIPEQYQPVVNNILRDRDPFGQERWQRQERDRGIEMEM
jgi:seryl-tRNA synthetase